MYFLLSFVIYSCIIIIIIVIILFSATMKKERLTGRIRLSIILYDTYSTGEESGVSFLTRMYIQIFSGCVCDFILIKKNKNELTFLCSYSTYLIRQVGFLQNYYTAKKL